uniref:Probable glycerophosphoryl diester phosphodiesterase 3 n=1 Tax=Phallusia mammillata TaxID=59560 RepID=A0A6F9DL45_9ASCI|nr:probable glycerophosphoryl diester phosphodiesterase 3 [Phallusia mammillata]
MMALDVEKIKELREELSGVSPDNIPCDPRDYNRIMHDDKYANCFLLWRQGNVELAYSLALVVLKWRKEKEIYDLKADDFSDEIIMRGIIYTHGKAKDGSLLVYFVTRQQTKDIKAQVQRLLTMWLERIQQAYPGQSITFLLDVSKSSLANVDLGGIKFMLECFTTNFPGMLEKIIILEMPWIMNAIWKVVKQWMTENQRKKTVFSSFKDLKQYIDPDQLHPYMGGTDNWEYSYPPFADDIPDVKQQYPNPNGSMFEECEGTDNFEETVAEEEFVVDDLEITATSQIPVPQDSSSVIMDDPQVTVCPDSERASHPSESVSVLYNGDDMTQDNMVTQAKALARETTPRIVLSEAKEETVNRVSQQKVDTENEIKLGNLLSMNPISEVIFSDEKKDKVSGRYQSTINLTSLTSDDVCVAFKVKTTSPERYHVKPSSGKINADGSMTIRISLAPGSEEKVSKDRFLILYQTIEKDEDIASFWREHTSKDSRNEYRLRVKFNSTSLSSEPNMVVPQAVNNNNLIHKSIGKSDSSHDQLFKLSKEVSSLRRQVQASDENVNWLRSKLQISLFAQGLLLLLLLFALHKLSAISSAIEIVWRLVTMPTWLFTSDCSYLRGLPTDRPLIIAHRGSSGMLPEHTVAAYQLAVQQGADIIECDLAITKDLKLICSHDAFLSPTTDVKSRPEFRNKLTTRTIAGVNYTDYFTVDFTLQEILRLRKIQRFSFRDQSYNGWFPMATFDDYVSIAKNQSNTRTIGIYPETKNPKFYNQIIRKRGQTTSMEELLLASLHKHGYVTKDAPCLIQSFSLSSLQYMSPETDLPLILLTHDTFSDEQLVNISRICYGIGVDKKLIVELKENKIWKRLPLIQQAHNVGLKVHGFTYRNEYMYLAWDYGEDPYMEYKQFIGMGIDGLFTDFALSLSNYMHHEMKP